MDYGIVKIKKYEDVPIDRHEILHYLEMPFDADTAFMEPLIKEILPLCKYQVCYAAFPITTIDSNAFLLDLGFTKTKTQHLSINMKDCKEYILFASTIGFPFDRLIEKQKRLSTQTSVIMQAIGAERIESLCNKFCKDLEKEYGTLKPRYSPGYGDLKLSIQKDILQVLDCQRKIGITLNDSLLMSPSKSVTAFVGIQK